MLVKNFINLVLVDNKTSCDSNFVLVYITDKVSTVTTPVKKLVAFNRIHLEPGESKDLKFLVANDSFKLYDTNMKHIIEPGKFDIIIGNDILRSEIAIE